MRIHYISCHSVLEYDEVKLLTELGHIVHSNGAYRDPAGAYTLPRPGIPGAQRDDTFFNLTAITPKTALVPKLIEPYDCIVIMHSPEVLFSNWDRIKHKKVIWRSIGQSTPGIEERLRPYINEGLKVVRYSKKEENIPHYAGSHEIIYFYKDPEEFKDWNGNNFDVINFTQTLKGRRNFTHHDEILTIGKGFNFKVYGSGNDDLGELNGGDVPFEMMKQLMRNSRVFVYGGTWPAPYTLSFMEAMMTGIPMVAIGPGFAQNVPGTENFPFYEIPEIIEHGVSGFWAEDLNELRQIVDKLLSNHDYAKTISAAGRERAILYFGKAKIMNQWRDFLNKVSIGF